MNHLSNPVSYGILPFEMERIEHFVPGRIGQDAVLPRVSRPIPAGVTKTYIEAYTDPGELVLVPYCQDLSVVREVLAKKRRVMALNFDPVLVLALQTPLFAPSQREQDAALVRLGDSLKHGIPLRQYLTNLYATTCPACQRSAVADYFIWNRGSDTPTDKHLRCPACGWDDQTGTDAEDRERLAEIPKQGMHYHYVLDRLAPSSHDDTLRPRLEQLLALYSSRNLYALAELTIKIESLYASGPMNRTLKALLLHCLDQCSSLTDLPSATARQQGLRLPSRFLERNVWYVFEEAFDRFKASKLAASGLSSTLEAFQPSDRAQAGCVGLGQVRDLPKLLSPLQVRLILLSPPPLSSAAWSLSYMWGAWLLGAEAAAPLRPLLRQRTPDPAWYARVMGGSFRKLASLLNDNGKLVLILTDQRSSVVDALLLAATEARLGVASLGQRGSDYRLELVHASEQPDPVQPDRPAATPLAEQIQKDVTQVAVETIQARAEPISWRVLHAAVQRHLAKTGILTRVLEEKEGALTPVDLLSRQVRAALEDSGLTQIADGGREKELWWLEGAAGSSPPLCDRVEEAAHQILQQALETDVPAPDSLDADSPSLTKDAYTQAVYARFPTPLVPEADLVAACLDSYAVEVSPGHWRLRSEDMSDTRRAERQAIVDSLFDLGQRLGYRTTPAPDERQTIAKHLRDLGQRLRARSAAHDAFDVAWHEGDQVRAVFAVRWRAAVSEVLALNAAKTEAIPYLVIPGGRAALVNVKLARNPLWQEAMDKEAWRFIKYRHVRQLVAQTEVDEYALRTIIGLDPIVEREQVQLSLF